MALFALFSNTSGNYNTASGHQALYFNTTGEENTAFGKQALYSNISASHNTAIGFHALRDNTTGSNNTAIGWWSLLLNLTGEKNTATGTSALYSNSTGNNNTANGTGALANNLQGNRNTANGSGVLFSNNYGYDNTASGYQALYTNTTGNGNTATGHQALYSNFTDDFNTAVGFQALYNNRSGGNTAIGYQALYNNISGFFNTAIGILADVTQDDLENATAIGYNAQVNASDKVRIGNEDITVIEGQVAFSHPSDARFKYHIKSNVPGLDFITQLNPVTYYFDTKKLAGFTKTGVLNNNNVYPVSYTGEKQLHTGFLAQDVEKIAVELGYQFDGLHKPANKNGHYSLAYSQFVVPLVKAVQEQQAIIDQQNNKIEMLVAQMKEMNKKIEALTKKKTYKVSKTL